MRPKAAAALVAIASCFCGIIYILIATAPILMSLCVMLLAMIVAFFVYERSSFHDAQEVFFMPQARGRARGRTARHRVIPGTCLRSGVAFAPCRERGASRSIGLDWRRECARRAPHDLAVAWRGRGRPSLTPRRRTVRPRVEIRRASPARQTRPPRRICFPLRSHS